MNSVSLQDGRAEDCDCKLLECVCLEARKHKRDCRYRFALTCAIPIECDHGLDTCPICDPCTCTTKLDGFISEYEQYRKKTLEIPEEWVLKQYTQKLDKLYAELTNEEQAQLKEKYRNWMF
jgi:hypothetical protein